MKNKILPLFLLLAAVAPVAAAQDSSGAANAISVYPSFHVKFGNDGGNYLLSSIVILNVSGYSITDIHLTQTYPGQFEPEAAPEGIHEYVDRATGFSDSIDGATYEMHIPILRRRELTAGFVLLRYDGRPSEAQIPAAKVEYKVTGNPQTQDGPPLTLDLKKYTKYSGSLSDFLKRYAGLIMKIPVASGPDWGFTGLADRVKAKTPFGLVEIDGDSSKGRFSLGRGVPGESQEILCTWVPLDEAKPAETEAQAKEIINRQTFASVDFETDLSAATIENLKFARGKAWRLSSTWKDKVQDRLGGGPILWYVYNDSGKKVQYVFMLRVQGRGAGPDKAGTPAPEKEGALMKELEEILASLRVL